MRLHPPPRIVPSGILLSAAFVGLVIVRSARLVLGKNTPEVKTAEQRKGKPTLTLHPDGTYAATSPDHTRTLHSHSPPATAA
jgi:hypothetical protein